jgi:dipeptidyl aminopeptidase/acylaminoacyl peptidase
VQWKLLQGLVFLLLVTYLFPSCQRELSYEGNIDHNQPPIALAGPDLTITLPIDSVMLDGSNSSDPDGKISAWQWTKVSGPASSTIVDATAVTTTVKHLKVGVYQFELKVTDDKGASAKDTMMITVDSIATSKHPPIACAGIDQSITLPTNSVTLNGSCSTDRDNNITSYVWTKVAGPTTYNITSPNTVQTPITNLTIGVYQFELKVTDADALIDRDTMIVTVMAVNKPPTYTKGKIVFVSDRDGNAEIYSCNPDGSNISRLTNNVAMDDEPAWSPDGSHIAFVSGRTGHFEIYIMNADGSNVVRRTFLENYTQNPAWSPDGARIAYSSNNGSANISVVGAMSGSPSVLFEEPGRIADPSWSPDGTKLALVSDRFAYDFVYDIFTINADGTNLTALTGDIFDDFDYLSPSWSPSGTKIAVMIIQTIGTNQYNTQIGVMNSDGSGITKIISGGVRKTKISWVPDGTSIIYTSLLGSRKDISWVSADGSASGTIVTNGWNADWQH